MDFVKRDLARGWKYLLLGRPVYWGKVNLRGRDDLGGSYRLGAAHPAVYRVIRSSFTLAQSFRTRLMYVKLPVRACCIDISSIHLFPSPAK